MAEANRLLMRGKKTYCKRFAPSVFEVPSFWTTISCLHDQNKSGFLEGRLFSSQSELFEHFFNCSDWLDKSRPSKKASFVLIM